MYNTLASVYDVLFPLNQKTFEGLASLLVGGGRILDVGAGTGTMALALAKENYRVEVLEPSSEMLAIITSKIKYPTDQLPIYQVSMEDILTLPGEFDCIYCIGNTLSHCKNRIEIVRFITGASRKLKSTGKLILQFINIPKVLEKCEQQFPKITKNDYTFERTYHKVINNIEFKTKLYKSGELLNTSKQLLCFYSLEDVLDALDYAGFSAVSIHNDFTLQPFNEDGQSVVIIGEWSEEHAREY